MNISIAQWDKYRDHGLLVLRIGLGLLFILHGWPKLFGGPVVWAKVGSYIGFMGIHFAPTFWGFMAASAEFFGGILLALGLFTRISSGFLGITMIVAFFFKYAVDPSFISVAQPLEDLVAFISLMVMGGGKFSLDAKYFPLSEQQK